MKITLVTLKKYETVGELLMYERLWAYGVVVCMFDFHRRELGLNPGRGGKIS